MFHLALLYEQPAGRCLFYW